VKRPRAWKRKPDGTAKYVAHDMAKWERVLVRVPGFGKTGRRREWRRRNLYGPQAGSIGPAPGFTWSEVASRDGVAVPNHLRRNMADVCAAANQLRARIARAYDAKRVVLRVTSGYRSPSHNAAVGGASRSRHLYADALDLVAIVIRQDGRTLTVPPRDVAALARSLPALSQGGVGTYTRQGFTHIDRTGGRRSWGA
jgi:uncharacterized protein YcbK (DUF882 family)